MPRMREKAMAAQWHGRAAFSLSAPPPGRAACSPAQSRRHGPHRHPPRAPALPPPARLRPSRPPPASGSGRAASTLSYPRPSSGWAASAVTTWRPGPRRCALGRTHADAVILEMHAPPRCLARPMRRLPPPCRKCRLIRPMLMRQQRLGIVERSKPFEVEQPVMPRENRFQPVHMLEVMHHVPRFRLNVEKTIPACPLLVAPRQSAMSSRCTSAARPG